MIGCFETVTPLILPEPIGGFNACYPSVEIAVRDGDQYELKQGFNDGKFDLTLLYNHDLDNNMVIESLQFADKPYVLLPACHQFASTSLEHVPHEPMILLNVLPSRKYFVSLFTKADITPNIIFRSPSIAVVYGMVGLECRLAMLVTRHYCKYGYHGQPLATIKLDDVAEGSALVATWLNHRPPTKPGYCIMHLSSPIDLILFYVFLFSELPWQLIIINITVLRTPLRIRI